MSRRGGRREEASECRADKFIEFSFRGIGPAENLEELNLFSTGLDCLEGVEDLEDTAIVLLVLLLNNINEPILEC